MDRVLTLTARKYPVELPNGFNRKTLVKSKEIFCRRNILKKQETAKCVKGGKCLIAQRGTCTKLTQTATTEDNPVQAASVLRTTDCSPAARVDAMFTCKITGLF